MEHIQNCADYRGCKIVVGEEPNSFKKIVISGSDRKGKFLRKEGIGVFVFPGDIDEEADMICRQGLDSSARFEIPRSFCADEVQALAMYVRDKLGVPKVNGLDLGSGATGWMVHRLLTDTAFVGEVELNPNAVKELKRRYPGANVIHESYLELRDLGIPENDVITGLSSLDATCFLGKAILEIRNQLKGGGYLFHVQDTMSGSQIPIQWMMNNGYGLHIEVLSSRRGFQTYFRVGNEWISNMELFRRHMGQMVNRTTGMELIFNDWVVAESLSPGGTHSSYNGMLLNNRALSRTNTLAAGVVTVARKI